MTESEQNSQFLVWYQPISVVSDQTSLSWHIKRKTYDLTTHAKGVREDDLAFEEYGITNPLLAKSIIALFEMGIFSLSKLQERLQQYAAVDNKEQTISHFFESTSGPNDLNVLNFSMFGAPLTGELLERVCDFKVFNWFDRICLSDNPEKAVRSVDAFVAFYTTSRTIVSNQGELIHAKIVAIREEAEATGNPVPSTIHFRNELIRQAYRRLPVVIFQDKATEQGFTTVLSLLATFLQRSIEAHSIQHSIPFTVSKEGEASVVFEETTRIELENLYLRELVSGVTFLESPENRLGPRSRRAQRIPLEEVGHSLMPQSRTIEIPGRCPFLYDTWVQP